MPDDLKMPFPVLKIILTLTAIVMTKKDFELTYNAMWKKLYNIAYSYFRDSVTAQQVTEDVFVNLWMNRDSLPPIQDLQAYLLHSLKNKIYNQFDKIRSTDRLEQTVVPTLSVLTESTEQNREFKDVFETVNNEIDRLPVMPKTAFG